MVPLFSRRSIVVLSIGLIVGILGGLGFWYISPLHFKAEWPPVSVRAAPTLYASTVIIEPVAKGADYTSTKTYQREAEYWAYKLASSPFFIFLSGQLAKDSPTYAHTPDELAQMVNVKVKYGDVMTVVQIKVSSESKDEASYLAGGMPNYLRAQLISEEMDQASTEYQNTLLSIQDKQAELAKVNAELDILSIHTTAPPTDGVAATDGIADDQSGEADLAVAKATVQALNSQLGTLTAQLASLIAGNSTGEEYQATKTQIEMVSIALTEARANQAAIEAQSQSSSVSTAYTIASAKASGLSKEIDALARSLSSLPTQVTVQNEVQGLFYAQSASDATTVPTDKIRGRNAILMGAVVGLCVAWLGLNFRGLVRQVGSSGRKEDSDEGDKA